MQNIQIYSTQQCPYCISAKILLKEKDLEYEEIDVSEDMDVLQEMIKKSGNRSVPQIFINGDSIGGYLELAQLSAAGNL